MKESRLFPKKRLTGLLALTLAGLLSLSGALAADYADGVYQDLAPVCNDDVIVSVCRWPTVYPPSSSGWRAWTRSAGPPVLRTVC